MKKTFAISSAMLVLSSFAAAQNGGLGDITPYGWSIRGGIVLPLDANLRSFSKDFTGIGVDYPLQYSIIKGATTFVSIDWITKSFKGNRDQIFPINLNVKFNVGNGEDGGAKLYAFAGVGATIFNISTSKVVLGGRVGLGADLNQNFFFEGSLFFSDRLDNASVKNTTVGFYLGYRF